MWKTLRKCRPCKVGKHGEDEGCALWNVALDQAWQCSFCATGMYDLWWHLLSGFSAGGFWTSRTSVWNFYRGCERHIRWRSVFHSIIPLPLTTYAKAVAKWCQFAPPFTWKQPWIRLCSYPLRTAGKQQTCAGYEMDTSESLSLSLSQPYLEMPRLSLEPFTCKKKYTTTE